MRSRVGVTGIFDDIACNSFEFFIRCILEEFVLQTFAIKIDEALHALALHHHHDQLHYLLLVLPQVLQPQKEQQFEVLEDVRLRALHQIHVVLREFEGGFFEVHVAGRAGDHETEIDVDDVAVDVHQDIVVVSILDVEEVLDDGIAGQTLDEVGDRSLPVFAEDLFIDHLETALARHLLEVADCAGIVDELNQSTIRTVGYDRVWSYPDFDVFLLEDIVDQRNQLHRHVLLP